MLSKLPSYVLWPCGIALAILGCYAAVKLSELFDRTVAQRRFGTMSNADFLKEFGPIEMDPAILLRARRRIAQILKIPVELVCPGARFYDLRRSVLDWKYFEASHYLFMEADYERLCKYVPDLKTIGPITVKQYCPLWAAQYAYETGQIKRAFDENEQWDQERFLQALGEPRLSRDLLLEARRKIASLAERPEQSIAPFVRLRYYFRNLDSDTYIEALDCAATMAEGGRKKQVSVERVLEMRYITVSDYCRTWAANRQRESSSIARPSVA